MYSNSTSEARDEGTLDKPIYRSPADLFRLCALFKIKRALLENGIATVENIFIDQRKHMTCTKNKNEQDCETKMHHVATIGVLTSANIDEVVPKISWNT